MKKQLRFSPIALAISTCFGLSAACAQLTVPSLDDSRGLPMSAQIGGSAQGAALLPQAITLANQRVGQITIKAQSESIIADGQSQVRVQLQILGKDGQPLNEEVILTLEVAHGLINLKPNAPLALVTDKHGRLVSEAEAADLDELTPGIQVKAVGALELALVAPFELKDIHLRVTAGAAEHSIKIKALPELRDMIAVGVIEGQIRLNQLAKNLVPANEGDLFERELRRANHEFSGGQGSVGARAAFFLKGKIKGEYLLTAAADSEKATNGRMFKDIDPNAFYPVYGDSSVRGADAQTRGRLYVRVDKDRSYLLYGDYSSATSSELIQLGNFSRAATGLRWHFEDLDNRRNINAFASYTNLTQVVDEIPGRGISGPYGVSNPNGIGGTERIDIIVRDRNQTAVILKTTPLVRGSDYEFEPFSGKILFKAPIPSVDENLNPVSIRISYEVEQGGDRYWIGGVNAEWQALGNIRLGASLGRDNNPLQSYSLGSLSLRAQLAEGVRLTIEGAHSQGLTAAQGFSSVASASGTRSVTPAGGAARVQLDVNRGAASGQIKWLHTGNEFDNPSANITAGRTEFNGRARYQIDAPSSLRTEILRSEDQIANTRRDAALIEYERKFSSAWGLRVGIRHAKDQTTLASNGSSLGASSGICASPAASTSSQPVANTGYNGGFGIASANGVSDSLCNNGSRFPVAAGSIAAANPGTVVDSLYARLSYQPPLEGADGKPLPPKLSIFGEAEMDVRDNDKHRWGLGATYQIAERTRLYARAEDISSINGVNGLSGNTHQKSFVFGAATSYAENAQVYNEYRLSSATTGQQAENALGLRNSFLIKPGLKLSTNAEYIKVFSGTGSDAKALGAGLDYTGSASTKASGRLEWRQDNSATNWLSTTKVSHKANADWTLLAQNYLSLTQNRAGEGNKIEDRFIIGVAYRPIETNVYNALMRYEHRTERDGLPNASQPHRLVDIISLHGDWHPARVWHLNGRFAVKRVNESFNIAGQRVDDAFNASLLGARAMYDFTDRWSAGAMLSALQQTQPGSALQYGYGLEVGYAVTSNLWFNFGYTWRGLNDKDLVASEFRNRGLFFGLRFKFDENLMSADNPRVNKSLEPR